MPVEKAKRVFLVCKSKKCNVSKKTRIRCTLSMIQPHLVDTDKELNKRKFCPVFSTETVLGIVCPHWVVSPDKPGERKRVQQAQESEVDFYIKNPDFLEVV